jgi:acyl-CoA synthetase (AMP-forming)/AMP-acid ligase II
MARSAMPAGHTAGAPSSGVASVYEAFSSTASIWGSRPFLHVPAVACRQYSPRAIEMSYDDVLQRANELAGAYLRQGYGVGQRVGLVLENRPCFFAHFLALNSTGASIVPVSAELTDDELRYVFHHCDAGLIVALPMYVDRLGSIVDESGSQASVWAEGAHNGPPPAPVGRNVSGRNEAALLYTSGTTGRPKGCILSNEYFLECGRWYTRQEGICGLTAGEERLITPLPLNHSNALAWSFTAMLLCGGCVVQLDRFHPGSWWESVRQSRATIVHYLGVMPALLLKSERESGDDFSGQIKFGFGAGVDPRHHGAFEERFGFPLIEAWAMTETGAGAVAAANGVDRHVGTRCIGLMRPETEYRLVDESGNDAARGMPGELLVRQRGPESRRYFFSSYYKDADATEQAWAGGWFHTGDIVSESGDGLLHFVDRSKNIIRRSGENIASIEVEGVLLRHPAVKNCAVAPVPDEIRGEEVCALITLKSSVARSDEIVRQLFDFCGLHLAYHKVPGYIAFLDSLPLTGSQKIQRRELRKLAVRAIKKREAFNLTSRKRRSCARGSHG